MLDFAEDRVSCHAGMEEEAELLTGLPAYTAGPAANKPTLDG